MPRTKLKKTATKRNRNSASEDLRVNAVADLDKELELMLSAFNFQLEQKWDQIRSHIKNIKAKLPPQILAMTVGELQDLLKEGVKTYEQAQEVINRNNGPLSNITNSTLNGLSMSAKFSRQDDGYITGDSARSDISKSGRQLGPFQSAKAKSRRRSKSVNSVLQQYNKAPRSIQIVNRNTGRESRSRFRTPTTNRIQTMSADRCMGPVTPKVQIGQSVAMLRYARQGETVISLSGSPVVASSVIGNNANINIPIANGVFSIQPSADGVVDPRLVSQIDANTLEQLRQLQDNLDIIMQVASNI